MARGQYSLARADARTSETWSLSLQSFRRSLSGGAPHLRRRRRSAQAVGQRVVGQAQQGRRRMVGVAVVGADQQDLGGGILIEAAHRAATRHLGHGGNLPFAVLLHCW